MEKEIELVKRLNKDGKYTNEYVLAMINAKRDENLRFGKPIDDGIEHISLEVEYASVRADRKFSTEYMERMSKKK